MRRTRHISACLRGHSCQPNQAVSHVVFVTDLVGLDQAFNADGFLNAGYACAIIAPEMCSICLHRSLPPSYYFRTEMIRTLFVSVLIPMMVGLGRLVGPLLIR